LANDSEMLEELKKIRALLEPKPSPPPQAPPKGLWNEFKDFLSKYKVLGLAVAFILGLYLGTLVQSVAQNLLLPGIGLILPGMDNLATYNVNATGIGGAKATFGIGGFLVALITFIFVALIIFLVVKVTKRWGVE
jgi:large conductance mechanosensitive channel